MIDKGLRLGTAVVNAGSSLFTLLVREAKHPLGAEIRRIHIKQESNMNENWKLYENKYLASDCGRVLSFYRKKILKIDTTKRGYKRVSLTINGSSRYYFVHRIVAKLFIDNPDNKPCVNHKDGDKSNNHVSNLEWCTYAENVAHAVKNRLYRNGPNCNCSKLTHEQVKSIKEEYIPRVMTLKMLAKKYGVTDSEIYFILKGMSWKYFESP